MSKAKERALEAYPIEMSEYSDSCREYDSNESERLTFIEGYQQAEKDNELTWEDLKMIDDISDNVYAECDVEMFDEKEYYQEVLKRFKETKR